MTSLGNWRENATSNELLPVDYSMRTLNNQVNKMKRKANSNIDSNSCPSSKFSSATVALDSLRDMDRRNYERAIEIHENKIGKRFEFMKRAAFDKDANLDSEMRPFNDVPNDQSEMDDCHSSCYHPIKSGRKTIQRNYKHLVELLQKPRQFREPVSGESNCTVTTAFSIVYVTVKPETTSSDQPTITQPRNTPIQQEVHPPFNFIQEMNELYRRSVISSAPLCHDHPPLVSDIYSPNLLHYPMHGFGFNYSPHLRRESSYQPTTVEQMQFSHLINSNFQNTGTNIPHSEPPFYSARPNFIHQPLNSPDTSISPSNSSNLVDEMIRPRRLSTNESDVTPNTSVSVDDDARPDSAGSSVKPSTVISDTGTDTTFKRKPRIPVPDKLKDKEYRGRRDKNNSSAKKSREKRKAIVEANRVALAEMEKLRIENEATIAKLEEQRQALQRKCLALGLDYS
ncbi:hypothetical protein CHUAL_004360 [Chamberlinius hualienensis]